MTDKPDLTTLDTVIRLMERALGRKVQLCTNSLTRYEIPFKYTGANGCTICTDESLENGEIEFK